MLRALWFLSRALEADRRILEQTRRLMAVEKN